MSRKSLTLFRVALVLALVPASLVAANNERPETPEERSISLRDALRLGLERNLELRVEQVNVPIREQDRVVADAEFDPEVDAGVDSSENKTPTASTFADHDSDFERNTGADAGIRKKFQTGLESRLAFETFRESNNSATETLDPQYRSLLVLDLTQPLLRDRGVDVNTTAIRTSENDVQRARYTFLDRAQRITEEIELAYYDLALAHQVLRHELESRDLTRDLLDGNRQKFEAGVVPVTEVLQAETASADRDLRVVFARQLVESVSTQLNELLAVGRHDALYAPVLVTGPVPPIPDDYPDFDDALSVALSARPDLQQQKIEIANRNILLKFYDNQKLPRVDLVATLGLNGLSGDEEQASLGGTSQSASHEGNYFDSIGRLPTGDGYEWFGGLRFSYPLGNRAAEARYRRADWERRQAIYELQRLENTAQSEIEGALVDVGRSLERYRLGERFETLADTLLRQETERLKEGLSDTFRIVNFQDDLIQARIRKVTALADVNKGLARLYRAMGANLDRHGIVAAMERREVPGGAL